MRMGQVSDDPAVGKVSDDRSQRNLDDLVFTVCSVHLLGLAVFTVFGCDHSLIPQIKQR